MKSTSGMPAVFTGSSFSRPKGCRMSTDGPVVFSENAIVTVVGPALMGICNLDAFRDLFGRGRGIRVAQVGVVLPADCDQFHSRAIQRDLDAGGEIRARARCSPCSARISP